MKKFFLPILPIIAFGILIGSGTWILNNGRSERRALGAISGSASLDSATGAVLMSQMPASTTLRSYLGLNDVALFGQTQSDWSQTSTLASSFIKNKPIIPATQLQSDWAQTNTTTLDYVKNKNQFWYQGVRKNTYIEYVASSTVSGGTVVFNITDTGTSGGSAVCNTFFLESVNLTFNDHTAGYSYGNYIVAGNKKTLTANVTKLGTTSANALINLLGGVINFLTGFAYNAAPNGTAVYLQLKCEP